MLRTTHSVVAGPAGSIFAIKPDGDLVYYRHLDYIAGGTRWEQTTERIIDGPGRTRGVDWTSFRHLAVERWSSSAARLVAVESDGTVVLYVVDLRSLTVSSPTTLVWGRRSTASLGWPSWLALTASRSIGTRSAICPSRILMADSLRSEWAASSS